MKPTDTSFRIDPVSRENAHHVGTVFRSIYGESFPVRYVYQPDAVLREIEAGRLVSGLALDGDGLPAGYVSMFRVSPNPRLWEAGNVVVVPRYAQTDIAFRLVRYGLDLLMDPVIDADGMLSEAVCCHYFTQIHTANIGMTDCGIAIDQLDGDSFKDGKSNKAGTERVSCVVSFMEVTDPSGPEYVPAPYEEMVRRLLPPLRSRALSPSTAGLPVEGVTHHDDTHYASARTWKVSVPTVGRDWPEVVANLLNQAAENRVISLQVTVDMACPHIGAAVAELREQGFFFGGMIPRWFGSDGLLMQTLFDRETDYDDIKVYSQTAKDLLAFIRSDRETVPGR